MSGSLTPKDIAMLLVVEEERNRRKTHVAYTGIPNEIDKPRLRPAGEVNRYIESFTVPDNGEILSIEHDEINIARFEFSLDNTWERLSISVGRRVQAIEYEGDFNRYEYLGMAFYDSGTGKYRFNMVNTKAERYFAAYIDPGSTITQLIYRYTYID